MSDLTIQCPKCHHQFPLSEAMTSQIEEHLKHDFDQKLQLEITKAKEEAAKLAAETEKAEKEAMYSYLSSPSFRQKVETIVETFTQMHTQLQKEKTAMKAIWDMREMQIQRVIDSTTRMYGEMKGIIGQTMPDIDNLQLDDGTERKLISE